MSSNPVNTVSNRLSRELIDRSFSPDQIDKWIDSVAQQIGGVSWKHVGWTPGLPDPNNAGVCEVANDKRAPIMEIVFNCIDAVIDLAQITTGLKADSPHKAVANWPIFQRPDWSYGRVSLSLRDSGMKKRPTLDIRDLGRGQNPDDFGTTFLSLHSSSKLSLPHLCGKFGMGMKSAFKFCDRLVVVSRPHSCILNGRPSEVGVSIVRRNVIGGYKVSPYEYLCDANGQIIRLNLNESYFDHGSLVRLSRYDMEGYHGGLTKPNNSIYLMLNSYMIDAPLNLQLNDRRGSSKDTSRFRGLLHNLKNPKVPNSLEESFGINVDFEGTKSPVIVHYFVLHDKASPRDRKGTKVKDEQGITFSHNGQRHGVEPRSIFKSKFRLGVILNRLVVVVDTSGLHPDACRDLYSSNRIGVNNASKVYDAIMDSIKARFDSDEHLKSLDVEATNKRWEDKSGETESVEKAVAAWAVGIMGKSIGKRSDGDLLGGPGVARNGGNRSPRNRSDSHLPLLPTRVIIDNQPLTVPQGRFAYLTLDIDAKNGYIEPCDGKVSVVFEKGITSIRSEGRLVGGKLRLIVDCPEAEPKGESDFEVRLIDPDNNINISTKGRMKVVDPKKGKSGSGNKRSGGESNGPSEPHVNINWVYKHEWHEVNENWNSTLPGECFVKTNPDGSTLISILLNGDFAPIEKVRSRLPRHKGLNFETKMKSYTEMLAKALLHQQVNEGTSPSTSFAMAFAESVLARIVADDDVDFGEEAEEKPAKASIPVAKSGILASPTFAAESAAASLFNS